MLKSEKIPYKKYMHRIYQNVNAGIAVVKNKNKILKINTQNDNHSAISNPFLREKLLHTLHY